MLQLLLLAMAFLGAAGPARPLPASRETVEPNDNRHPAGALSGTVLRVTLEARTGMWYPEGPTGMGLEVAAWAEPGKATTNPGPLIRVTAGTEVRVTLRNTLSRPLFVFGMGTVRGLADSVAIAGGAEQEVRFTPRTPGTYYYLARGALDPTGLRPADDSQLNGAIVVDPPGARRDDRIFIISWWFRLDSTSRNGLSRATMTMNGLSWPHTERIDMVQGDSAYWRVINLTEAPHPMHLHGFYFQMRSKGNGVRDSLFPRAQWRLGVTETIAPFETMTLAWSPTRSGNWIYHCHFIGHVSHTASLDMERGQMNESALAHHGSDRPHQMYGLVLGIRVAPRGEVATSSREPRRLRLEVREKPGVYGSYPGYAYVLGGSPAAADPDQLPGPPAPMLLLTKDEPVAVTIVNRAQDRAAVHWHGIELDSYPDGVPDWSGSGKDILPSVAPGDSITVTFTPRAGLRPCLR